MTGLLNISAEDAEEYSQSLAQIGEGFVRQITWAFDQGIPEAQGMSRIEWRQKYYGHLKLQMEPRREALKELEDRTAEEAAEILGVSEKTVDRDRAAMRGTNVPADPPGEQAEQEEPEQEDVRQGQVSLYEEPAQEAEPEIQPDSESEPLQPAEPGWHKLGPHLLYCGDSTDPAFIEACKGTFAFADPPYNAGKADWDDGFEWDHDYLIEAADIVAVTPGIAALKGFHTITTMPYQWSIAAEITNGMTRGALGFGNWIYVALFSNGSLYRNAKDYLRVPAHTGDDKGGNHAARKPLRLLTELIGLFTSKGDTVIDPFLGSGTTLIAADRLERRCIGAETDPMHCAEIIARYNAAVE